MSKEILTQDSCADFWLNNESLYQYIPEGNLSNDFSIDLIQLAAYRRIVSNFVFILTHLDIPVRFCSVENFNCIEKSSILNFTDGKTIYLSASIRKKSDFDWNVGVALHEASHILLTDFDVAKSTFYRIPIPVPLSLKKKAKEKNILEEQIAYLCKWVWNYVEDRYIDSYIFKEAPGYRGYYKAMYNKFWNSEINSKALKSEAFRIPNFLSYEFRVINLTNPDTDLDALIGLKEIAELININNIFRLKTTTKRIDLSYKIVEIIIDNVTAHKKEENENSADATIKKIHSKLSNEEENEKEKTNKKDLIFEDFCKEHGIIEYSPYSVGNTEEFTSEELKELDEQFDQQRNILDHRYGKIIESVTKKQESILDTIEKSGIVLIPSGLGLDGDYTKAAVDCVVVKKLTKHLIDSGQKVFPLAAKDTSAPGYIDSPPKKYEESVVKGFVLGKLLGKKLQIRGEENITKYIRKQSGKIERRLLSDIGAGIESIFNKVIYERYNKIRLHISVDSSGSMSNENKWCPTISCVVAICVAASMVENLEVSVSFRSTIGVSAGNSAGLGYELPYIVLAYDSKIDKISKVRQLFPYLCAKGSTPEGLAFEAITEEFIIGKKTTEQSHYFLNISDGEPFYMINASINKYGIGFDYSGETGALHTKSQIDKIRSRGVKILSYFINGDNVSSFVTNLNFTDKNIKRPTCKEFFTTMYGKDAQYIDVQNVTDIAKTINKLFLFKV